MSRDDLIDEPHEGGWFYLSAPFSHLGGAPHLVSEQVKRTIEQRGWAVLTVDDGDPSPAQRLAALAAADACVFDVSGASGTIGAEVATALCRGRPVIALEHAGAPAPELITALVEQDDAARLIQYGEVDECGDALGKALADPAWLEAVGRAAVHAA